MSAIPDPIPDLKQQLARAIMERFEISGQWGMARKLGIDQPRASNIERGRLERFSLQQLVRFIARADGEVSLTITWHYPGGRSAFNRCNTSPSRRISSP